MKLVALLSLSVLAIAANAALSPTVQAESRTPAEATAHALDELQNAVAQGKITLTPTPTPEPTATWTSSPTATSTPQPTDTPTSVPTATPEPAPCWLTDPDTGDIVFDKDGAPVPCPVENAQEGPSQAAEPTPTPTPTSPVVVYIQAPAAPVQPQAPAPAAQVVVQTVIVEVTPVPAETPAPTPIPATVVATAAPTVTRTSTATPTATRTAAATATVLAIQSTPVSTAPVEIATESSGVADGANRGWLFAGVFACAAIAVGALWLTRGRRRYVL